MLTTDLVTRVFQVLKQPDKNYLTQVIFPTPSFCISVEICFRRNGLVSIDPRIIAADNVLFTYYFTLMLPRMTLGQSSENCS